MQKLAYDVSTASKVFIMNILWHAISFGFPGTAWDIGISVIANKIAKMHVYNFQKSRNNNNYYMYYKNDDCNKHFITLKIIWQSQSIYLEALKYNVFTIHCCIDVTYMYTHS